MSRKPTIPPMPRTGGSYLYDPKRGAWVLEERTIQPHEPEHAERQPLAETPVETPLKDA